MTMQSVQAARQRRNGEEEKRSVDRASVERKKKVDRSVTTIRLHTGR